MTEQVSQVMPTIKGVIAMKDILKKVPHPDYIRFRQTAIARMGWTRNQYQERYRGRTPLTYAEREVLERVVEEITQEDQP